MSARQTIFRVRRNYNQWVANETLEDYALRFTARRARRWSGFQVAVTALGGAVSFLALEAIGASITLHYGFVNSVAAILAVGLIIFFTAIPISYYAARYGVDIDLLTRGAGFGYIGSTVTSLIYASFTFIFFALEAAIMAMALKLLFGIPLVYGYLLCALIVIPLVTHGITLISRFQLWTQPLWLVLQVLPFIFILMNDIQRVDDWTAFTGAEQKKEAGFSLVLFGAASAVLFSLMAQIGEQVDFLRFLPEAREGKKLHWWTAMLCGGPGWIIPGCLKLLAGSFLVVLALQAGVLPQDAIDPTHMYQIAFGYVTSSPDAALALAGLFVIVCQLKINVTNAYAGSIAWSNFFSRLTHSHPGRVVWLVFNVAIALLLMELGVYQALEQTLGTYAIIAVAWLGTLVADLVINKPLGLSPKHIEFRRAHLYDINPVGVGSMALASLMGLLCHTGLFGDIAQALSHFITLLTALVIAPLLALVTRGKYYLARPVMIASDHPPTMTCCICEHHFETDDMSHCPAYAGPICSLCCSLDARCNDFCKPGAGYVEQIKQVLQYLVPVWLRRELPSRIGHFLVLLLAINSLSALLLSMIYFQSASHDPATAGLLAATLWKVFFLLIIITGVVIWLFVLAHESRVVAQEESLRQNRLLSEEIDAHEQTDRALQAAKEQAEAANLAKSRYLTGISHELRSPLNAVLGYAQLLENDPAIPAARKDALVVIRRSGEHLADLIEGLLDISKIEAGKLDLHRDEVRIPAVIEQLVHMFRLQAEAKGLVFDYQCRGYLPEYVYTDEKRLRQILINLLSNAVKYTRAGTISFTVSYRNQVAEFIVRDTGEGIAPENMERIFRPFERVTSPRSTVSGTGLGLTITRLLTDIMGGDISVRSEPGQGSQFRVALMLSSISRQHDVAPVSPQQRIIGYTGARRHIVVIDDDDSHRALMHSVLTPLGFTVTDFNDPRAALVHLTETPAHHSDAVLLDVSMPGISGWNVVEQLRQQGFTAPVIMISADASEGRLDNEQDDESPRWHNAYLTKPVRLPMLFETLARQLALEWIDTPSEDVKETEPEISHEKPAETIVNELLRLAAIGHKKGLLDYLHLLETNRAAPHAFVEHSKSLAAGFRFEQLASWLTDMQQNTASHYAACAPDYASDVFVNRSTDVSTLNSTARSTEPTE